MDLPEEFLDEMRFRLGNEYEQFANSYNFEPFSGLRVNVNKISVDDFCKIAPYPLEPVPFVNDGFYIRVSDGWSKHPYYFAGLYYLQEPSAMLPANRLEIDENDCVLDLCAAPGGKTTKLMTYHPKVLVSNDISYSRTIPLVKNMEMTGGYSYLVTSENPEKLCEFYKEFFDKIIIDAPCSGEGMFRKDSDLVKSWINKRPEDYVDVQKSVLDAAYIMLKPGGKMMYSTCTFSALEDEENILYLLDKYKDLELCNIKPYEGFDNGYSEYVDINSELVKCVHIFPHKMKGEGHFMALIKKEKREDAVNKNFSAPKPLKYVSYNKLNDDIREILSMYKGKSSEIITKSEYLIMDNGMVFMICDAVKGMLFNKIRYVRTGLNIGMIGKNKRFLPSTALALAFDFAEYSNGLNISAEDNNVYKYLKGDTLLMNDCNIKKGYVLIGVDGYSLGFTKYDGNKFKNLYEKGWVMN